MAMVTFSFHHLPQCLALHKVADASLRPFAFVFLRLVAMSILILQLGPLYRSVHQCSSRCGSHTRRHLPSVHNTPQRRLHLPPSILQCDLDIAGKVVATLHMCILANEIAS